MNNLTSAEKMDILLRSIVILTAISGILPPDKYTQIAMRFIADYVGGNAEKDVKELKRLYELDGKKLMEMLDQKMEFLAVDIEH